MTKIGCCGYPVRRKKYIEASSGTYKKVDDLLKEIKF
jgi:hypothetical protein